MPKRRISKRSGDVASRPLQNASGQFGRPLKKKRRREVARQAARFGPHNDSAPDPDVKTKKPFNPFNTKARVDEAKKGTSPFG